MDVYARKTAFKSPYTITGIEFPQCSTANTQDHNYSKPNIIIGGAGDHETTFVDLQVSMQYGKYILIYKSFEKDYKKLHGHLFMKNYAMKHRKITEPKIKACGFHSFLINKNKYLMVFRLNEGSNVYDIENDNWLLNKNDETVVYSDSIGQDRAVLVTDEIFVISFDKELYFYYIDKNDVVHPKFLKRYTIKRNNGKYKQHGLVCTNLKTQTISDDARASLTFELIIFGGSETVFGESFIKFFVDLSYDNINIQNIDKKNDNDIKHIIKIEEKEIKIEPHMIVNDSYGNSYKVESYKTLWQFGYQCLLNKKKEVVIIIVGGYAGRKVFNYYRTVSLVEAQNTSVILFNLATKKMQLKSKVCVTNIS